MIKLTEKIGYGFGDMASSMFWKPFGAYLMIFYTDVVWITGSSRRYDVLITRIWDSVFDPIVGVAADRTQNTLGKISPLFALAGDPVRRYWSAHFHDSLLSDKQVI